MNPKLLAYVQSLSKFELPKDCREEDEIEESYYGEDAWENGYDVGYEDALAKIAKKLKELL